MDYKKQKEIIQSELEKAQLAGDTEKVEQLRNDLTVVEANIAEDEHYAALAATEAYRKVRLRDVLSDYFMKRKGLIKAEFIARLKETYLREPVTADQYGSYKDGLFTYGSFIVEVVYDRENHVWQLSIFPEAGGVKCPHNVALDIRYRFIPDDCLMCEVHGPRAAQGNFVNMYQMPTASEEKQEPEEKKPGILRRLLRRKK